jgi:sucrose-phosphate synthase
MASGLPVVATRFGGPSETMKDSAGEYGVLVDPDNPEELAAGLFSLIGDKKTWKNYHHAGYQRVLDRYTWSRTAEGYLEVCKQLVKKKISEPDYPIDPFFTGKSSTEPSIDQLLVNTFGQIRHEISG